MIYTYIHTYIHTYVRTYVRTYVHTYIHTYLHIYIYTYIYIDIDIVDIQLYDQVSGIGLTHVGGWECSLRDLRIIRSHLFETMVECLGFGDISGYIFRMIPLVTGTTQLDLDLHDGPWVVACGYSKSHASEAIGSISLVSESSFDLENQDSPHGDFLK